jgi:hypothetical protein
MPRTIARPAPAALALAAAVAVTMLILVVTGHGGIAGAAAVRAYAQFLGIY